MKTRYNKNFEFSQKNLKEIFEKKFTDNFEGIKKNMEKKFDRVIKKNIKNLKKKKDDVIKLFKDKFIVLIEKEKKGLSDEIIKDIFNNFEKNMIEEIKNQMNTNIINIENNYLLSKEMKLKQKVLTLLMVFLKELLHFLII